MRAVAIVRRSLNKSLQFMHAKRREAFWKLVTALIIGGRLAVTQLGRATRVGCAPKHAIKMADRLISNKHLHHETPQLFQALTRFLNRDNQRPIILVDWTPVGVDNIHHALVASIPMAGRAMMIYEEVYPEQKKGKPKIERRFLQRLKEVLPEDCRPILVTDAGFRMPWFDDVRKAGWDFVGRLTSYTLVKPLAKGSAWFRAAELYARAKRVATDYKEMQVRRSGPRRCRVILAPKRRSKGRQRLTRRGRPSRRSTHKSIEKQARQPWVLVTSLAEQPATLVLHMYRLRMQIEETFRDIKSHRFGWSFADTRSGSCTRLQTMLLLAAFAALATMMVGCAVESAGMQRYYQANTVRKRRVLSLFFLGINVIKRRDNRFLTAPVLSIGLRYLHKLIDDPLGECNG